MSTAESSADGWQDALTRYFDREREAYRWHHRAELHDLSDTDLGLFLTRTRRSLVMADEDNLPPLWLQQCHDELEWAEAEWDWRTKAERRGGPTVARANFRERLRSLVERQDMLALVGRHVLLQQRVGDEWRGLCPFHEEHSPSFYVNRRKQLYHCFGCGEGGDLIEWVMTAEKLGFMDAVRFLEQHAFPALDGGAA